MGADWKIANEFYFKSLAAVQLLQQTRLKHHQDFTSEQVELVTNQALSMLVNTCLLLKKINDMSCLIYPVAAILQPFCYCIHLKVKFFDNVGKLD